MNTNQYFQTIRVGAIAVGLLALSGTGGAEARPFPGVIGAGNAAALPGFNGRIEIAAEAPPVATAGPDQVAKPPAKPDVGAPAVEAKLNTCKAQWSTVDSNGDGIVDDGEVAHYNETLRAASQPVLADGDRLTEADFLAACSAATAHE